MKRLVMTLASISLCFGIIANAHTPAQKLIKKLTIWQQKGVMMGHQDALFYGTTWKWEFGRSDVKDVCGDYPAVLGCELGGLELGHDKNIDGVPFDKMREQIQAHYQRGGIITISWHPHNPVTAGTAWEIEGDAVAASLSGGKEHAKMKLWLQRTVNFMKSLKTTNGEAIPIIFRPWHEMNGDWFWWGTKSCTPQQYIKLFKMTVDYFRQAKLTHIVWSYSPNASSDDTPERFFSFYPGDKYVDLLGVDLYQHTTKEEFIKQGQQEMGIMHDYAEKHNKLYAITEGGYRNTPDPQWYSYTLLPALQGYRPCYVLLWRNAWDNKEENFGPAPNKVCVEDFKRLYRDKKLLFLKDISNTTNRKK